jgi:serine/threonine-protein kinase
VLKIVVRFVLQSRYVADPGFVAIHPGDMLAGYRVTRLLGRGGMGEVWAGVEGKREVAIKVLLQRAAMKPDLVRRFEREAKITSAINSPFVCRLLEVQRTEDGTHLLVFEALSGESLSDRLKREQYLPLSEVGGIIDDVLQGLVAAHAAGVVHRDLKPGNIFVERTGDPKRPERAKVLDFGISKIASKKEEPTLTAFDATLGSFAYMAPEQIRGAARADERADIYAIGAVAFRALAGRLPFEGSSAAVLVSLKLDRNAPSLAEATGEKWPAGVERFLEKALARHREKRFETASEALQAWRAIQPGNITRVKLPPSHSSRRSPPPADSNNLSFTASAAAFPEDMPTEVDDSPPTMTGADNNWGATGANRSKTGRGSSEPSPAREAGAREGAAGSAGSGRATPAARNRKQGGR